MRKNGENIISTCNISFSDSLRISRPIEMSVGDYTSKLVYGVKYKVLYYLFVSTCMIPFVPSCGRTTNGMDKNSLDTSSRTLYWNGQN